MVIIVSTLNKSSKVFGTIFPTYSSLNKGLNRQILYVYNVFIRRIIARELEKASRLERGDKKYNNIKKKGGEERE